MSNKTIYIQGKAKYARPFHLDTGENMPEDSDIRRKIEATSGIYSADIVLDFDNRDDAEEYLNKQGVPTDGMLGNLLKRKKLDDGTVEITYKVKRGHMEPAFENPLMGPPKVVDADNQEWDSDVLIGNGSDVTVKLNVWRGTKATKIRWDGLRVDSLVEYIAPEGDF